MTPELSERRLFAWWGLVGSLIILAFLGRETGGEPADDLLYRYDLAVTGIVFYGLILALVLLIARGRERELLALRRPSSWARSIGLGVGVLLAIFVFGALLERAFHAGEEQGFDPGGWRPDRAGAFAANFVVVAAVTPAVEELVFRGLGFSLLRPFGQLAAILIVGIAFGLAHGIFAGIPVFTLIGVFLAVLRSRTDSIYPPIGVHAAFNGLQLIAAVTIAGD
ncbi:MAG: CPBP family intramembrane metalloprotease [Actinomycetota bacterium]|nr:CPBP family intramembrane metalloprotease [Actinomycetota bacterium]